MKKHLLSLILVSSVLITLLLLFFYLPLFSVLSFESTKSGKLLAFTTIEENQEFAILYTHSVHLTPVEEKYIMTNDHKIKQYELIYESYNVGMPSNVEGEEQFVEIDGKFHIKNMDRRFSYIDLSVGQIVANHRLIIKDQVIPFSDFVEPGALVRIQYQKLSAFEYLKGDEIVVR